MRVTFAGATRNRIGKIHRRNEMASSTADLITRPLSRDDAGALVALESRCEGAAQWGEPAYHDFTASGFTGWAATRGNVMVGFIVVRSVADEMEIMNLGVEPDSRRQGIAARLIVRATEEGRRAGVKRAYLEVRESNATARAFYSSLGFAEQGRRKHYYSQPIEDALVLTIGVL